MIVMDAMERLRKKLQANCITLGWLSLIAVAQSIVTVVSCHH